jgi:hypothetical protein
MTTRARVMESAGIDDKYLSALRQRPSRIPFEPPFDRAHDRGAAAVGYFGLRKGTQWLSRTKVALGRKGLQTDQHPLIPYGVLVPCIGLAMTQRLSDITMFARVTSRRPGRWLDVVRPARLHERLVVGNHDGAIHA